ncbi:hypothetical protein Tco_1360489 [Tanacetum coccineum]
MTCSNAITPDLPITDSLIMEDEHLDTIPKMESDEENVSSVKDLNLTPNEFAGELTLLKSIPPGIDDDNLDPEGEIHLVERLLYDNSSPRPPEELNVENSIESFHLHL